MAATMIEQARRNQRLKSEVPMNGFDIVRFGEDHKYAQDLNACHAIAIISTKAAILGHIAPSSPQFPKGDQWTEYMVSRFLERVHANKDVFEKQGSGGVIVFGVYQSLIALPEQLEILVDALGKAVNGIPKTVPYPILGPRDSRGPHKGMVFIEGFETGQLPVVWVEDRQVSLML